MADTTVASAVVVPESQEQTPPKSPTLKRRQSSVESTDTKRPRLVSGQNHGSIDSPLPTSPNERRRSSALGSREPGAAEERKRGQRLFGALLGTLSQSSTSAAQRRRADIEKKQQDKLREKDQELDEERRQKVDKIISKRKTEQTAWEKETVNIQQRNALAMAHFLKTEAMPHLYYKPWELLPQEEQQIQAQTREIEDKFHGDRMPQKVSVDDIAAKKVPPATSDHHTPNRAETIEQPKTSGEGTQDIEVTSRNPSGEAENNGEPSPVTNKSGTDKGEGASKMEGRHHDEQRTAEDHGGEELLEGAEDDVIY